VSLDHIVTYTIFRSKGSQVLWASNMDLSMGSYESFNTKDDLGL